MSYITALLISILLVLCYSSACSIPLETSVSSVIVTGGWWSGYAKKVTQYTWSQGLEFFSVSLPELLEDRAYHGCGKFMDSNNKNVRFPNF